MNGQHLGAFFWLRWRLFLNQLKRGGIANAVILAILGTAAVLLSLIMLVTAFIGVYVSHPRLIERFESEVQRVEDVLECHHVTGAYTLLLKIKTVNTSSLEALISRLRSIDGVEKTETMVVLSTNTERSQLKLPQSPAPTAGGDTPPAEKKARRNGVARTRIAS